MSTRFVITQAQNYDKKGQSYSQPSYDLLIDLMHKFKKQKILSPGCTYCKRLEKWEARGFQIAIPGLVEEKVSRKIKEGLYYSVKRSRILLRIEQDALTPVSTPTGVPNIQSAHIGVAQRCRIVTGFEYRWANYLTGKNKC